ncbi:MAG: hypothetical protein QOE11_3725 [Solirubrobacteraceae bacterium]|jgi:hypothetical protein|nr:hypothetical protein [Solirubrobacteraceae bacterium]
MTSPRVTEIHRHGAARPAAKSVRPLRPASDGDARTPLMTTAPDLRRR